MRREYRDVWRNHPCLCHGANVVCWEFEEINERTEYNNPSVSRPEESGIFVEGAGNTYDYGLLMVRVFPSCMLVFRSRSIEQISIQRRVCEGEIGVRCFYVLDTLHIHLAFTCAIWCCFEGEHDIFVGSRLSFSG